MESQRSTQEQKILDFAIARTKAWDDAAQRAELRGALVTAMFFRNCAWETETGKNWLDDVTGKE